MRNDFGPIANNMQSVPSYLAGNSSNFSELSSFERWWKIHWHGVSRNYVQFDFKLWSKTSGLYQAYKTSHHVRSSCVIGWMKISVMIGFNWVIWEGYFGYRQTWEEKLNKTLFLTDTYSLQLLRPNAVQIRDVYKERRDVYEESATVTARLPSEMDFLLVQPHVSHTTYPNFTQNSISLYRVE